MSIPLVDLKAQYLSIKPEIDQAIQEILNNTSFIMGPPVKNFEDNIDFKGEKKKLKMVKWVGHFGNSKVVVAEHPQGKDETKYVEQVFKSFQ